MICDVDCLDCYGWNPCIFPILLVNVQRSYIKGLINLWLYFILILFTIDIFLEIANQCTNIQIRQCYECFWGMSMNDNEEMFAGNAYASCPDADPDAT